MVGSRYQLKGIHDVERLLRLSAKDLANLDFSIDIHGMYYDQVIWILKTSREFEEKIRIGVDRVKGELRKVGRFTKGILHCCLDGLVKMGKYDRETKERQAHLDSKFDMSMDGHPVYQILTLAVYELVKEDGNKYRGYMPRGEGEENADFVYRGLLENGAQPLEFSHFDGEDLEDDSPASKSRLLPNINLDEESQSIEECLAQALKLSDSKTDSLADDKIQDLPFLDSATAPRFACIIGRDTDLTRSAADLVVNKLTFRGEFLILTAYNPLEALHSTVTTLNSRLPDQLKLLKDGARVRQDDHSSTTPEWDSRILACELEEITIDHVYLGTGIGEFHEGDYKGRKGKGVGFMKAYWAAIFGGGNLEITFRILQEIGADYPEADSFYRCILLSLTYHGLPSSAVAAFAETLTPLSLSSLSFGLHVCRHPLTDSFLKSLCRVAHIAYTPSLDDSNVSSPETLQLLYTRFLPVDSLSPLGKTSALQLGSGMINTSLGLPYNLHLYTPASISFLVGISTNLLDLIRTTSVTNAIHEAEDDVDDTYDEDWIGELMKAEEGELRDATAKELGVGEKVSEFHKLHAQNRFGKSGPLLQSLFSRLSALAPQYLSESDVNVELKFNSRGYSFQISAFAKPPLVMPSEQTGSELLEWLSSNLDSYVKDETLHVEMLVETYQQNCGDVATTSLRRLLPTLLKVSGAKVVPPILARYHRLLPYLEHFSHLRKPSILEALLTVTASRLSARKVGFGGHLNFFGMMMELEKKEVVERCKEQWISEKHPPSSGDADLFVLNGITTGVVLAIRLRLLIAFKHDGHVTLQQRASEHLQALGFVTTEEAAKSHRFYRKVDLESADTFFSQLPSRSPLDHQLLKERLSQTGNPQQTSSAQVGLETILISLAQNRNETIPKEEGERRVMFREVFGGEGCYSADRRGPQVGCYWIKNEDDLPEWGFFRGNDEDLDRYDLPLQFSSKKKEESSKKMEERNDEPIVYAPNIRQELSTLLPQGADYLRITKNIFNELVARCDAPPSQILHASHGNMQGRFNELIRLAKLDEKVREFDEIDGKVEMVGQFTVWQRKGWEAPEGLAKQWSSEDRTAAHRNAKSKSNPNPVESTVTQRSTRSSSGSATASISPSESTASSSPAASVKTSNPIAIRPPTASSRQKRSRSTSSSSSSSFSSSSSISSKNNSRRSSRLDYLSEEAAEEQEETEELVRPPRKRKKSNFTAPPSLPALDEASPGGSGDGSNMSAWGIDQMEDADQTQEFCVCKKYKEEEMIACDNEDCSHGGWFHFGCIGIATAPEGSWYCRWCTIASTGGS